MKMYLQEAFQAMSLLEEEDFSLTNASVKDILDFKNNDEELNILSITDPDTTEEDELKDSYIGSVILECEVCHSPIFKNVEDVVIDEDSDLANIEDECPICHSNDGFTIIGQVTPYQEEPELEVEIEDKEVSDIESEEEIEDFDDDIVDDDITDAEDDEIKEPLEVEEKEEIEESLTEASSAAELLDYEDDFSDASSKSTKDIYNVLSGCLYGPEFGYGAKDRRIVPNKAKGEHTYKRNVVVPDNDGNIVVWQPTEEDLKFAVKLGRYFNLTDGIEFEGPVKEPNKSMWKAISNETTGEKTVLPYRVTYFIGHLYESLREGFEKVDLEMEDKIIHVSEEEKDPIPEAEMITPVSDELETELLADDKEEPINTEMEDEPMIDEPALDDLEVVEDSADNELDLAADDEEINYDIDEFEEDNFDELGESYLKEVYDNISSFKTSNVSLKNEQLVVEGVINFNSGKSKNTQFIFEAKDATKAGNVRFVGENKQISRGKKAFELRGKMQGSKFIAEALNYNYRAKNSDGKSTRLYGTVRTTRH